VGGGIFDRESQMSEYIKEFVYSETLNSGMPDTCFCWKSANHRCSNENRDPVGNYSW
jgi:hypothetical protein